MIKDLRNKVSLIVFFAIALPLIIGVIIYDFSYYNNVITSNVDVVDRFIQAPDDNVNMEKPKDLSEDGERTEPPEIPQMPSIEGVYSISIENGKVISSDDDITDEMKEYALSIYDNSLESGIVGNYIYKKKTFEMYDNKTNIILVESSNEIKKINLVVFISIIISIILIVLIFILAKKIASIIVKPVEETFNKQRDFISDASHELKTPLAVISANADVLEGEIGKNKWLSYIQNETDNMGKLIAELLLLTKIENIDKLREPEKFNISNHVELVVASFESMAYEKKVKIETSIQSDIVTEIFNKDDITHILSTLVDNAIKHSKDKVIVELNKSKDKLIINVKNKGKEIPVSEREKIFDRFYRIDKSRNRNDKRYGLGLSIAKATVIKNNGSINVDYKDGYTIFTVELPKK